MRLRNAMLTIALAALPVVAVATPANAATCNLIVDAVGDAGVLNNALLRSDHVDIVSGDVASGPTTVVAVLRLKSLDPDLASNLGPAWKIGWNIGTNNYTASVRRTLGPIGSYITEFSVNGTLAGPVSVAVDVTNDTITWTIPRSLLPDLATPGATFTALRATTTVLSSTSDIAFSSTATYVDQSPSCVPAA